MYIFDGRYFRLNKYLLFSIGLWPSQPRLQRMILLSVAVLWIGSLALSQAMILWFVRRHWNLAVETISPLLVIWVAAIKIVNNVCNDNKIKTLIALMEEHWKTVDGSETSDIMQRYAAGSRRMTIIYMVALYTAWWSYSTMPVMELLFEFLSDANESLILKPLYHYDVYLDVQKYQYPIFFFCMGAIFYIVTIGIACDSLFICFVQHVCGLFAVVQYDIKRIQENENFNIDLVPPLANDEPYHKIIKCIHKYNEALQFTDILASTYTTVFLFLVGIVMIDLSFTGAEMALHADSVENFVRCIAEASAEIIHFYFNNLPCQKIIDHSLLIHEAVYSCRWYGVSLRSRKMLAFMLLRSSKPCQITAAQIYVMSMENFSAVLKASMSYFTMLTSLQ